MNKIEITNNIENIKEDGIVIKIDLAKIDNIEEFIKKIYDGLGCPKNFGLNLNAFFDTIKDTAFWVKKPLYLLIENFNGLTLNIELRMLISDILIDITLNGKNNYYFIYINNEK